MKTKKRCPAKIGTHSSTILVIRDDITLKQGKHIYAMEAQRYNALDAYFRDMKDCQYWERYLINEIVIKAVWDEPFLFVEQ